MSDNIRSFLFAGAMCIVCSILLTAASTWLKPFQLENLRMDKRKNILKAVGLITDGKEYSKASIDSMYDSHIKRLMVDDTGKVIHPNKNGKEKSAEILPIYCYKKKGKMDAYVIPINTEGLWGEIKGYLALKNDGATIDGFTVYQHSETPGLGGEIEQNWFENNFKGKKIVDLKDSFVSISIAKGKVKDFIKTGKQINYVDGISGATLTGKFLSIGLKKILSRYEPVSIRFRNKNRLKRTSTPWCGIKQ